MIGQLSHGFRPPSHSGNARGCVRPADGWCSEFHFEVVHLEVILNFRTQSSVDCILWQYWGSPMSACVLDRLASCHELQDALLV